MTEAQRDYLADLAAQKGIRLGNTDDKSESWASAKIAELEAMSDAEFAEISEAEKTYIAELTERAR